jgi:hypothetical protein
MRSRTVLIGYSVRGRLILSALLADGRASDVTVIDSDARRAEQAALEGLHAVVGTCWRLRTLWMAGVHAADHVVVAVPEDDQAERITAAVRSVNDNATIILVVRDSEPHGAIDHLGADHVLNARQAWLWKPDAPKPERGGGAFAEAGWTVVERAVTNGEVGRSPLDCDHQVLAVLRDGRRLWIEDPAAAVLRDGDRVLVVSPETCTP